MTAARPACPGCGTTMETDRVFYDFACPNCGIAGPHDSLEKLAARLARYSAYMIKYDEQAASMGEVKQAIGMHVIAPNADAVAAVRALKSPAVVLAEAERLLREARVSRVLLSRDRPKRSGDGMRERNCTVTQFSELPYGDDRRAESGETVAEAYAALVKGGEHG